MYIKWKKTFNYYSYVKPFYIRVKLTFKSSYTYITYTWKKYLVTFLTPSPGKEIYEVNKILCFFCVVVHNFHLRLNKNEMRENNFGEKKISRKFINSTTNASSYKITILMNERFKMKHVTQISPCIGVINLTWSHTHKLIEETTQDIAE